MIPMSLPLENNRAVNPNPSTVAIPSRSRCDPRIEREKEDHDVIGEDAGAFGSDETLTESSIDEVHGAGDAASRRGHRPAPPTRIRVFFSSSNGALQGGHTVRHRKSVGHSVGHLRCGGGSGGGGTNQPTNQPTRHGAVTVPNISTNLPAPRSAVLHSFQHHSWRLHHQQPRKRGPPHRPEPPKKNATRHRKKLKLAGDGIDGAGSMELLPELDETIVDSITLFVAASTPPQAASLDTTARAAPAGTEQHSPNSSPSQKPPPTAPLSDDVLSQKAPHGVSLRLLPLRARTTLPVTCSAASAHVLLPRLDARPHALYSGTPPHRWIRLTCIFRWRVRVRVQPKPKSAGAFGDKRDRPFLCPYVECHKRYTKSGHLNTHLRVHTGEKPFVCQWAGCKWAFSRSNELTRHTRRHTGARPYACDECHRRFVRSDHLKGHAKLHLNREAPNYTLQIAEW
jgi:hypothetical protein